MVFVYLLINVYVIHRRFSGGFGSRDYRTSQPGGARPGGSMGPRTSGGGSFPNYNAPPPAHGNIFQPIVFLGPLTCLLHALPVPMHFFFS